MKCIELARISSVLGEQSHILDKEYIRFLRITVSGIV